jgi:hypothetical protein
MCRRIWRSFKEKKRQPATSRPVLPDNRIIDGKIGRAAGEKSFEAPI